MVANLPPPVKPRTSKKNLLLHYEPAAYAELISPTPLLLARRSPPMSGRAMVVEVDRKVPTIRTVTPGRRF